MPLINCIFNQNFPQVSQPGSQISTQSDNDNIYTLEDLIQTLEEVANYLGLAEKVFS
ncbi:serine dehydratase [Anabaena sp. UHCC 0451]|uniref:serine dehydratase n=1 Tax=Anabaena sp. UHCC 0451 TaxID=2055235 RepID=UPI002B21BB7B|nr:serine dehydratase [Anabaena sp. UHCC 0451]MEA5575810.1 serine dehydratase [Anabaena sp. UHCC 0451]